MFPSLEVDVAARRNWQLETLYLLEIRFAGQEALERQVRIFT